MEGEFFCLQFYKFKEILFEKEFIITVLKNILSMFLKQDLNFLSIFTWVLPNFCI